MPRRLRTDRTYVIVNISDAKRNWFRDEDNRSKFLQTSFDTLRKNVAGTKVIVKYTSLKGEPNQLKSLGTKQVFTHQAILEHLADPANGWIFPKD